MSYTVIGGVEYNVGVVPSLIYIHTTDSLATVTTTGYLTGDTSVSYSNNLMAVVNTTNGMFLLAVVVSGSVISLIEQPRGTFSTVPAASQSASLALGTAYQNTLGYDIMLTVYVNVTSALTASFLLGIGPTNTPTQQTIVSGLTLAALSIIPVNIYLPSNYYAKLTTSGTITASISGQIAMPI